MSSANDYRPLLFGIAYRMLGRVTEAEDMVQEAYLRFHLQPEGSIGLPKAWLTKAVTRLCIDQLRSARRQREEYVGPWLPEPLVEENSTDLADTLSTAFMLMLEKLSPVDRAVFLLREAFGHDYPAISEITGRSEAACRQIVCRAKERLGREANKQSTATEEAERLVKEFLAAAQSGELAQLLALLTEDAILYSDGGGRVRAALLPIYGPDRIGRLFMGMRRLSTEGSPPPRFVKINGSPGVVTCHGEQGISVMTFAFEGNRVKAVYIVRNPDKLTGIIP
ncbi:RNA polymerase sigma-70 factor [Luteolibacter luteus]|uniref:RNA polymerase sigma-70 factor n=1 Tax=Luteolibacter luteus TaxID=2728835 RepID=A0A858RG04_9BACT|nr:RNA polymerase sigma-70 factor [Luteolibacter luteus]QJE95220.1 RNA polymerase sigma-70 factor [Luteolibacter luteus]